MAVPEDFVTSVKGFLKIVTDKIAGLPDDASVVNRVNGGSGLDFIEASPMTNMAIVENDTEAANAQASVSRYVDQRDSTLHRFDGSVWYSVDYDGSSRALRPQTLCFSITTGKVFYCDEYLRLTRVNLTTASTPT